jgi:hypothetical protein
VRLELATDSAAYMECVEEVRSILTIATLVYPNSVPKREVGAFPKEGYCIRCASKQPCDPDRPLCTEDFKSWVQYKNPDYEEHYCHTCGKKGPATMAKPLCTDCTTKYRAALEEMDAKKAQHSVFYRNTWRRPVPQINAR